MKNSSVQAPSIYQKWVRFYRKHKMAVTLWLLFFLSIAVRTALASGMKLVTTYTDEPLYYCVAENLSRTHTFSMYYLPYFLPNRMLYPLLLSPAFLCPTRAAQFVVIALINATLLTSGMWPVYLLAKDVLENQYRALLAVGLYLFMPDMALTGTFMSDLCLLPEALWLIYFGYRLLNWRNISNKEKVQYSVGYAFFLILACLTKPAGILFAPILLVSLGKSLFHHVGLSKLFKRQRIVAFIIGNICLAFIAVLFYKIDYRATTMLKSAFDILQHYKGQYIAYVGYFLLQVIIAGGVFPILFPYIYNKEYDEKGRRLFRFMRCVTFIVLFAESFTQAAGESVSRAHLRYITFFWLPYIILFLKLFVNGKFCWNRNVKVGWTVVICWTASLFLWYRGAEKGSAVDYTLLYYVENWDKHWSAYAIIFGVIILITLQLLLCHKTKQFLYAFLCFWLIIQGYNNTCSTLSIRNDYECPQSSVADMEQMEQLIKSHSEDAFLLLLPPEDDIEVWAHRYADTFLNYPNVLRGDLKNYIMVSSLSRAANGVAEYDLLQNPIYSPYGGYYSEKTVDYLIIPSSLDCYVDLSSCNLVSSSKDGIFKVFKTKNSARLPHIASLKYLTPGHNYYPIESDFFYSEFQMDGKKTYISSEGEKTAVIYGPYVSWPKGSYTIVFYFADETGTSDECIGEVDVMSDSLNLNIEPNQIMSGEWFKTLEFVLDEQVDRIETRILAKTAGVRAVGVDVVYWPYD